MVQNLLVIKGNKDIEVPKELDDFYVIKADSLYDAAIEKLDIEFDSSELIDRIVYIDSDNFKYSSDLFNRDDGIRLNSCDSTRSLF